MRKLTSKEADAKYKARGMALGILHRYEANGALRLGDATKFVTMCRILLDIGSRGSGGGPHDPISGDSGPVPMLDTDSEFCPTPDRTAKLAPPPETGAVEGSAWIHVKWDELDYGMHLLVNTGVWRMLAFSLSAESKDGAARLSGMLNSTLAEYAVGGIPAPRAVARFMDAPYVITGKKTPPAKSGRFDA